MEIKYGIILVCLLVFLISVASASAAENDQTDIKNKTIDTGVVSVSAEKADSDAVLGISIDENQDVNNTYKNMSQISKEDIKLDNSIGENNLLGASIFDNDLLGENIVHGVPLYWKITNANAGDTVYLTEDYTATSRSYYDTTGSFFTGYDYHWYYYIDFPITKSITIDGQGHTIDAATYGRIFHVSSSVSVTFKNIIFKNGKSDGTTDSHVTVSSATDYGGAVYLAGSNSNTEFINCTFINNITSKL